jgi:hypothetical protein
MMMLLLLLLYCCRCRCCYPAFLISRADRYFIRALEMNRELFGNEHPEVAENLFGYEVRFSVPSPFFFFYFTIHFNLVSHLMPSLAGVQIGQLNYPKAEATLKEAIGITERTLGKK